MGRMKTLISKTYSRLAALCMIIIAASCADENPRPTLGDVSTFVPPVLKNAPTGGPVELLPDNATQIFENFEWHPTDYGINLSSIYAVQADLDADLRAPRDGGESSQDAVAG